LLFSAVIPEQFSKNRMIISVVNAKIWYLKKMYGFYWATLYINSRLYMIHNVSQCFYSRNLPPHICYVFSQY